MCTRAGSRICTCTTKRTGMRMSIRIRVCMCMQVCMCMHAYACVHVYYARKGVGACEVGGVVARMICARKRESSSSSSSSSCTVWGTWASRHARARSGSKAHHSGREGPARARTDASMHSGRMSHARARAHAYTPPRLRDARCAHLRPHLACTALCLHCVICVRMRHMLHGLHGLHRILHRMLHAP